MNYIIANELRLKGKNLKKLETVKSVFARAGKKFQLKLTTHAGHALEYAREITTNGEENTLIAMGGDGTLHEILNGFKNFKYNSLGLIPLGTGNDFAAAAGIPKDVKAAAELIAFHAPVYVDFIELNSGLRSLNAVGMGLDVDVLKRAYSGGHTGKSKYLRSLLATVFKFKGVQFTAEFDGKTEQHFGMIAALGNGRQIGGGIKLFPEAKIDDGMMDLILVDYISRRKLFAALFKLMRGKVNSIKEATVAKVKSAKIIPGFSPFTIQAEGELYDNVEIDARVVPDTLKFYL